MIITGTIVNVLAVLAGSALGLLFHARLPQRFVDNLFQAIGLFTLALGINFALGGQVHDSTKACLLLFYCIVWVR